MGKRGATGVVLLLVVAAFAAAGPAARRADKPRDTFGAEYEPASPGTKAVAATTAEPPTADEKLLPPEEKLPPPDLAPPTQDRSYQREAPPPPLDSPPSRVTPASASAAAYAHCPDCAGGAHPGCWKKLCDYFSYCPLQKSVNCPKCGQEGQGSCCCYHCFPPLYLFYRQPCPEGPPPPPVHANTCHTCEHFGNSFRRVFHLPPNGSKVEAP